MWVLSLPTVTVNSCVSGVAPRRRGLQGSTALVFPAVFLGASLRLPA